MYFVQGLTLGLAYVAPIGIQNMFVINTGISCPRLEAYRAALVVIFFDVTLVLAGFFGAGFLVERFFLIRQAMLLVGCLFVMYTGVRLVRSPLEIPDSGEMGIPLRRVVVLACVVTWFNPQAVIDVTLILGAFHANLPEEGALAFLGGVLCASCTWFLGLTTLTSLCRSRINAGILHWINRICGIIILGYGFGLGWSFVRQIY